MFEDTFIKGLSSDPSVAGKQIIDHFRAEFSNLDYDEDYEDCLRAVAVLQAFCDANGLLFDPPSLSSDRPTNIHEIDNLFVGWGNTLHKQFTQTMFDQYADTFKQKFGTVGVYEFSDGDIKRIQALINELRELITKTKDIEPDYRRRLLKRLEKLQAEMHKKISDVDRFWGLVGDAGIVLAQLGENAKPIVDRVREIAQIIWNVQTRAAGLPSSTPMRLITGKEEDDHANNAIDSDKK